MCSATELQQWNSGQTRNCCKQIGSCQACLLSPHTPPSYCQRSLPLCNPGFLFCPDLTVQILWRNARPQSLAVSFHFGMWQSRNCIEVPKSGSMTGGRVHRLKASIVKSSVLTQSSDTLWIVWTSFECIWRYRYTLVLETQVTASQTIFWNVWVLLPFKHNVYMPGSDGKPI